MVILVGLAVIVWLSVYSLYATGANDKAERNAAVSFSHFLVRRYCEGLLALILRGNNFLA